MRALVAACGLLALLAASPSAEAAAPARVVSMNLCTDQLAMLLAAPGQLVSVSALAREPESSAMAAEAAAWPVNHGLAEEIFLLAPDLVLAGAWTARPTVDLLERLGVPVLTVAPADSIEDARRQILDVGAALGRDAAARALLAGFDAALAAAPPAPEPRPTAAIVGASGYSAGPATLAGAVLARAGFDNVLGGMGMDYGGTLSLERLLMAAPDLLVLPEFYPGWSQAEEFLRHPALAHRAGATLILPDRNWVCGLPALFDNRDRLVAARRAMAP